MDDYRQVALCLHGLADPDRSWLLENLTHDHASKLLVMLQELEKLGIPREPHWPDFNADNNDLSDSVHGTTVEFLNNTEADLVFALLIDEPNFIVAILLQHKKWTWANEVMNVFGEIRCNSIRKEMNSVSENIGVNVIAALLDSFSHRIKTQRVSLQKLADDNKVKIERDLFTKNRKWFWSLSWRR